MALRQARGAQLNPRLKLPIKDGASQQVKNGRRKAKRGGRTLLRSRPPPRLKRGFDNFHNGLRPPKKIADEVRVRINANPCESHLRPSVLTIEFYDILSSVTREIDTLRCLEEASKAVFLWAGDRTGAVPARTQGQTSSEQRSRLLVVGLVQTSCARTTPGGADMAVAVWRGVQAATAKAPVA